MSTFSGLNTAASGLQANQAALNITGHNIANANNPNYTRQQAVLRARTIPSANGMGTVGNGVEVSTVRRVQDMFVEDRLRTSNSDLAFDAKAQTAMDGVVAIFGEPSASGLSSDMDKFWTSWQSLSVNPENASARQSVLQQGQSIASHLNRFSSQLNDLQGQQEANLRSGVDRINDLAEQLASINKGILESTGQPSNDLLDQRNAVLTDLSKLTNIRVNGEGNGGGDETVSIGGHILVQGTHASPLAVAKDEAGNLSVQWAEQEDSPALITGGEVGATLKLSAEAIPAYKTAVEELAKGLIEKVNTVHRTGTGLDGESGRDFFTGTGAGNIKVNAEISGQPRKIGASASGAPGDGSIALSLAKIKTEAGADGTTLNESYRSMVTTSAAQASQLSRQVDQKTIVQQQLSFQQQSVAGVSLDEEMTNMIRFQQAYAASARVVSAMDEMIDTLINRLGA